ncbi:MAG: CGGC domain-containing protein [Candidatus Hydrothermarchaeota archaeon]
MEWEEEALKLLEKVPEFARSKAKEIVESIALEKGKERISLKDVEDAYNLQFGEDSKKIAIIRCDIISEVCPGVGCLIAYENRKELFKDYGPDTKIVGFFTCGGCPGRRVFRLVNTLKRYGINAVHMSSCMLMEEPFTKCPYKDEIKKSIESQGIVVIEGTHHEVGQYAHGSRYHMK